MTSLDEDQSSFSLGEEFLAHYGVRGMRWGVRNDDNSGSTTQEKAVNRHYRNRRLKIAGAYTAYAASATAGIAYISNMFTGGTYKQSLRNLVTDPKNMALIWGGSAFGAVIRDQYGPGARRYDPRG